MQLNLNNVMMRLEWSGKVSWEGLMEAGFVWGLKG